MQIYVATIIMRRWIFFRFTYQLRRKHIISLAVAMTILFLVVLRIGFALSRLNILRGKVKTHDEIRLGKRIFSPVQGDYRLENPLKTDFSRRQSKVIDELLGGKENGFFLDIGAGNGETNSVSLYFERERKWHGVLVEANEAKHRWSIIKNRQADLWNLQIQFDKKVSSDSDNEITTDQLFTMINRTFIDLLIVNLNGLELDLVSHIDFTKYRMRVITIELQSDISLEKYQGVFDILSTQGYRPVHYVINSFYGKKDVIFIT